MNFIRIDTNEPPDGAKAFEFKTDDGAHLRGAHFPLDGAKGTFLILPGWSEFIEKYFETVKDLHARGYACAMMDWRGQGMSGRLLADTRRSHIDSIETYKNDLSSFFDRAVAPSLPGPYYLLAHSMGGLPSLLMLSEGDVRFRAAAFSAPLTKLKGHPVQEVVFRAIASGLGIFGATGLPVKMPKDDAPVFEADALTSDLTRFQVFADLQAADPSACVRAPTFGWVQAVLNGSEALHTDGRINGVKIPTLIASAEHDDLVVSDDHAALATQNENIEHLFIAEARHEILMESDHLRDQFFNALDNLIKRAG